jgi:hypothetical protein
VPPRKTPAVPVQVAEEIKVDSECEAGEIKDVVQTVKL